MIQIRMKSVLVLIPRRTATPVVRVIARELPVSAINLEHALIVRSALRQRQKRRPDWQSRQIDQRRRISGGHRDDHIRDTRQVQAGPASWYIAVKDHSTRVDAEVLDVLPAFAQTREF